MPPPINSHSDRWRGDASASRGNHTRGTETTRPSVSVTESASIEQDTSTTSASVFSVKVLIPSLQKELRILNNYFSDVGHLIRSKTPRVSDPNRIKPKLRVPFSVGYVDMRRLATLHTEKEEPIAPDPEQIGTSQVYRVASRAIQTLRRAAVVNPPGPRTQATMKSGSR